MNRQSVFSEYTPTPIASVWVVLIDSLRSNDAAAIDVAHLERERRVDYRLLAGRRRVETQVHVALRSRDDGGTTMRWTVTHPRRRLQSLCSDRRWRELAHCIGRRAIDVVVVSPHDRRFLPSV